MTRFTLLPRPAGLLTLGTAALLALVTAAAAQDATAPAPAASGDAAAATPGAAAPAPKVLPVPPPVAATLSKLTGGKAKILKAFEAPGGLIGIAATMGQGRNAVLYATPDGKYLVQGVVVSAEGENLTQAAETAFLPQPATPAENMAAVGKTTGYLWGKESAKKEIWIVFDPNCIFCHKTFDDLKPHVADGTLKVHVVQVGFLKPSSLGKAAAIMAAKDPAKALAEDETKFDEDQEEGGIAPDLSDKAAVAKVKANNQWMAAQGITGTPYLMYRDTDGTVQALTGYDEHTDALLADIGTAG